MSLIPAAAALTTADILRLIFTALSLPDLARAACVCRTWHAIASDRDVVAAAFKAPWRLREVIGIPSSGGFWRESGLGKFAISHRLRDRDSVAGLAVKYDVQVIDIKRLNNMMSDHGIHSRERLLVPIGNPDLLMNSTCYIELDKYAKREVAVLYLEGGPERKLNGSTTRVSSDQGKKRIIKSLRRSMRADDGTAEYYLSISDGDPRAALSEFSQDLTWERNTNMA
ncbi:hypothetical protein Droror1_Dr00023085 [Drosera rotundifolia]